MIQNYYRYEYYTIIDTTFFFEEKKKKEEQAKLQADLQEMLKKQQTLAPYEAFEIGNPEVNAKLNQLREMMGLPLKNVDGTLLNIYKLREDLA